MHQLFNILFPVFSVILAGYLYRRWVNVDLSAANRMNLDVFIPALLIDVLAQKNFDVYSYRWVALACLLGLLLSGVFAWLIGRKLDLLPAMFVPSMMFNNSGNMGLPLAVLAFGEGSLGVAVILFLVSNIVHSTLGLVIVGGRVSWWKLLTVPLNIAMFIGLVISLSHWQMPAVIHQPINLLGQIAVPLMLVSLGVRMNDVDLNHWRIGLIGGFVRPFVGVLSAAIVMFFVPLQAEQKAQLLLFSALPPAVLNYMFAEKYDQQPTEVASMVILGNALSIITLSVMLLYLRATGQLL